MSMSVIGLVKTNLRKVRLMSHQSVYSLIVICVFLTEIEGWYRAVVLNVLDAGYRVLYFDYGNIEEVPLQLIRPIPQALMKEPAFAIRCSLAGMPV